MNALQMLKYCAPPIMVDVARKFRPHADQTAPIRATINGADLEFPSYHYLPGTVAQYPFYDTALPQIAKFLASGSDRTLRVIDVGANVGDTAAAIASAAPNVELICVEANPRYLPFLRRNTEGLNVEIINAIAGASSGTVSADLDGAKGTSVIVNGTDQHLSVTVDDLAKGRIDLFKTDTDGYELEVLRGATRVLQQPGLTVFAEYSPQHIRQYGNAEPRQLLELMNSAGFETVLVYDSVGVPIGTMPTLGDTLAMLSEYCERRNPPYYLDLLFDRDLARLSEFAALEFSRVPKIPPPL